MPLITLLSIDADDRQTKVAVETQHVAPIFDNYPNGSAVSLVGGQFFRVTADFKTLCQVVDQENGYTIDTVEVF